MKFLFLGILLAILLLSGCSQQPKVCFDGTCFNAEVADTQQERQVGLMSRENMENNHGMLFIFEVEGNYPFWMKNTLIPLDMIWINKELEVVHIAKDVQPCKTISCPSTNPQANALYVFEINAGLAEQSNIEVGSKVTFFRVPSPSQR